MVFFIVIGVILLCMLPGMIVQINEYERGIKFSRGKFKKIKEGRRKNKSC